MSRLITITCIDCGVLVDVKSKSRLRCDSCQRKIVAERSAAARAKRLKKSRRGYNASIRQVLKNLEAYNSEHRTHLTYGQYVALKEKGG